MKFARRIGLPLALGAGALFYFNPWRPAAPRISTANPPAPLSQPAFTAQRPTHPKTRSTPGPVRVVSHDEAAAIENALLGLHLEEPEKSFFESDDVNRFERMIKKWILASRHSSEIPNGSLIGLAYLEEMKANPREAMDAISSALDKMQTPDFSRDRALLLDTATDMDGQQTRAHDLAIAEMAHPVTDDPDSAGKTFSPSEGPLIAHSIAMRMSESPAQAYNDTINGFQAQSDPQVRNAMAIQLLALYPQLRPDITAALEKAGTPPDLDRVPAKDSSDGP